MRRLLMLLAVVGSLAASACADAASEREQVGTRLTTVATGLHVPWGIAFLPSGAALVSERTTGKIIRIPQGGGRKQVFRSVAGVDTNASEGGLLGLAVSPHYRRDHWIYAYFTTAHDNRLVRFHPHGRLHHILTGLRRGDCCHNGGRIAFGPDGKLYVTVGETTDTTLAQRRDVRNGKILRINPNGSIPRGNPFKRSPIWSYGHRNPEGLAWDRRGRLWSSELGQDRVDEVNLIKPGRNYGWPIVEGRGSTHGGRFVNPKVTWPTSQASPGGDAIIHGRLYVAALRGESLWRMRIHGTRLGPKVRLLHGRLGRLRTVIRAPSGRLWIATSNRDGRGAPRPGDDRIVSLKVP